MERAPEQSPNIHEYRVLATTLTSTMQAELDEAARQGFRFVPQTLVGGNRNELVMVVERPPVSPSWTHKYLLLATKNTGTLHKEMRKAAGNGFTFVDLVSRREHMALFEKHAGPATTSQEQAAAASKRDSSNPYLLLATEKLSTMQKELNKNAAKKYRAVAGSATSGSEIAVLLEKDGQSGEAVEQALLASSNVNALAAGVKTTGSAPIIGLKSSAGSLLELKLNGLAADGFRLVPRTLAWKRSPGDPVTGKLARLPVVGSSPSIFDQLTNGLDDTLVAIMIKRKSEARFNYLVLDTTRRSTMQAEISNAVQGGYAPVAMIGPSITTGYDFLLRSVTEQLILVFEKVV
jgi:hypothetical protein